MGTAAIPLQVVAIVALLVPHADAVDAERDADRRIFGQHDGALPALLGRAREHPCKRAGGAAGKQRLRLCLTGGSDHGGGLRNETERGGRERQACKESSWPLLQPVSSTSAPGTLRINSGASRCADGTVPRQTLCRKSLGRCKENVHRRRFRPGASEADATPLYKCGAAGTPTEAVHGSVHNTHGSALPTLMLQGGTRNRTFPLRMPETLANQARPRAHLPECTVGPWRRPTPGASPPTGARSTTSSKKLLACADSVCLCVEQAGTHERSRTPKAPFPWHRWG